MARPRTVSDAALLEATRAALAEHGAGVSLATIARAVGLTAPALIRRFGSKDALLFRAMLPQGPPRWRERFGGPPPTDLDEAQRCLADGLTELCEDFERVGPALAALRTSGRAVAEVFPADRPGPPEQARTLLAGWLIGAGLAAPDTAAVVADLAIGAAEARGFLRWIGPMMADPRPTEVWAAAVAAMVRDQAPPRVRDRDRGPAK